MRKLLYFVALAAFLAAAATQVYADDRQVCFSVGSDAYKKDDVIETGMRACTRMIQSGQYAGTNLAFVYRGRGYWKDRKGDYDAAIQDFDEAIRLDPRHVEGYDYRSSAWKNKGNLDRAIADLDMAIRLDPTYAAAYYRRGVIFQEKGNVERARADYNAALAVPTKDRIAQWAQDSAREKLAGLPGSEPQLSRSSSSAEGAWGCRGSYEGNGLSRSWGASSREEARSIAMKNCRDAGKRGCQIHECRGDVPDRARAHSIWPTGDREVIRCVGNGCD